MLATNNSQKINFLVHIEKSKADALFCGLRWRRVQISFISENREAYHPTSRKAAYYQPKIHKILTFHCTNRKILVRCPFLWTEGGVNLVDRE